jgi:hypothetical protein
MISSRETILSEPGEKSVHRMIDSSAFISLGLVPRAMESFANCTLVGCCQSHRSRFFAGVENVVTRGWSGMMMMSGIGRAIEFSSMIDDLPVGSRNR